MQTPGWFEPLAAEAARLIDLPLSALIAAEPERIQRDTLRVGPIYASFTRQRIDGHAWQALYALAERCGLAAAMQRQQAGEQVNRSEQRAALHTALRSNHCPTASATEAHHQARATRVQMQQIAARLRDAGVTDLINVGIGGSDLGPRLLADALPAVAGAPRVHFLSAAGGHAVDALTQRLDPTRTAVLLVSKSFSTEETRLNGEALRDWLAGRGHLLAATAQVERAAAFGVDPAQILPLWDWVGGRYSLWSAVGFSLLLSRGADDFEQLLAGAAMLDQHVLSAPIEANLALRHALVMLWNRNALGYDTQAVLPYDLRLQLLPAYLQQLVMESLGKSVLADGSARVSWSTTPVIWGGPGTDCQHSYFQALHQGTDGVPSEFIGVVDPRHGHSAMRDSLLANLLAQSEALANGVSSADAHRFYPGSRPSTVLLLDALTPYALGALLALYEHSVYALSVLWGINAFDQWGVELGKRTAAQLLPAIQGQAAAQDPVSAALIQEIQRQLG